MLSKGALDVLVQGLQPFELGDEEGGGRQVLFSGGERLARHLPSWECSENDFGQAWVEFFSERNTADILFIGIVAHAKIENHQMQRVGLDGTLTFLWRGNAVNLIAA